MSDIITDRDPGDEALEPVDAEEFAFPEEAEESDEATELSLEQVLSIFRDTLVEHELRLSQIELFLNELVAQAGDKAEEAPQESHLKLVE